MLEESVSVEPKEIKKKKKTVQSSDTMDRNES